MLLMAKIFIKICPEPFNNIKQWQEENNKILLFYPPECFLHQFVWSWCHRVTTAWCSTPWPGMIMVRSSSTSRARPSSATLIKRSVWPRTHSLCTLGRRSSRYLRNSVVSQMIKNYYRCVIHTHLSDQELQNNIHILMLEECFLLLLFKTCLTSSICLPGCDSAANRVSGHGSASAGSAGLWGGGRRQESGWRRVAVWRTRCGFIGH